MPIRQDIVFAGRLGYLRDTSCFLGQPRRALMPTMWKTALMVEEPAFGQVRIANELKKRELTGSPAAITDQEFARLRAKLVQ
jgi:hypothetical protein